MMSSYGLSPMKLEVSNLCIYTLNNPNSSPVSGLKGIQRPHVYECMHQVACSEAARDRICCIYPLFSRKLLSYG